MASTIAGINVALVDEKIHEALKHVIPVLSAFSYQIEQADRIEGDTVKVPLATDPTVGTKTAGTFATATGELNTVTATYNRFRASAWDAVEAKMRAATLEQYWADKAAAAAYGVAKDVIDAALALVTATNYGNAEGTDKLTAKPSEFKQAKAAKLWGIATDKIKRQRKTFIMNTAFATGVFGDSSMALIYASANENYLKSGTLPRFLDLNQMHYGDMPDNSEDLGGAIFGSAAIAVAMARPSFFLQSGEGDIISRDVITDSDSGISLMHTVKASAGGTLSGEIALLSGVVKAQDAVVRLIEDDES
jgi:hypothetical protein